MNYFCYAIQPHSGFPIFQVNKHLGYDEEDGYGIDGSQLSRELFELDAQTGETWFWEDNTKVWAKKPELITIYVNCLGGDVSQGFDIFNAILNCKCKVKVVIQGFAYSTAGWCFLPADEIVIYDYSSWMCHLPYNPNNPEGKSDFLDKVANSIATILSSHSGKSGANKKEVDEVLSLMQTKTYYSGEEMKNEGFADDCLTTSILVKEQILVFNLEKEKHKVFNKFIESEIKNKDLKIQKTIKTTTMAFEKVINKLGLVDGSGEDSILAGIARIENDLNASNKEKISLEEKLKAANLEKEEAVNSLTKLQSAKNEADIAMDKLKAEKEVMDKEVEAMKVTNKELADKVTAAETKESEALKAANLVKAEALVNKYYEAGKIAPSNRKRLIDRAAASQESFESVELDLELLPTNMHVPVPFNKDGVESTTKDSLPEPGTLAFHKAKNKIKNEAARADWEEKVKTYWSGKQ